MKWRSLKGQILYLSIMLSVLMWAFGNWHRFLSTCEGIGFLRRWWLFLLNRRRDVYLYGFERLVLFCFFLFVFVLCFVYDFNFFVERFIHVLLHFILYEVLNQQSIELTFLRLVTTLFRVINKGWDRHKNLVPEFFGWFGSCSR